MPSCTYELFPLAERPEYIDQCIALLNEEWPRSTTQREASMAKTLNREPPMAFGLFSESGEIIGHAKLCPLPDKPTGCWLEALVVKREFRGKGTGRTFMTMLEAEARLRGYMMVYLSTHDKLGFYAKLGYKTTNTPVLNFGANSKLFLGRFPGGLTDACSVGSIQHNVGNTQVLSRELNRTPQARMGQEVDDSSCPHPPPAPIHGPVSPSSPSQKVKVYMWKEL